MTNYVGSKDVLVSCVLEECIEGGQYVHDDWGACDNSYCFLDHVALCVCERERVSE